MNTKLRKIKNNAKALSPVVASIILIAVTVAVSVAVAAWMGGMTLGFMNTEQVKITNVAFTGTPGTDAVVEITVQNTGSNPVTISDLYVSTTTVAGTVADWSSGGTDGKIAANDKDVATVDFDWANGGSYQIKIITSQGNSFTYQGSAPSS
jgi:flagellin-like protein